MQPEIFGDLSRPVAASAFSLLIFLPKVGSVLWICWRSSVDVRVRPGKQLSFISKVFDGFELRALCNIKIML